MSKKEDNIKRIREHEAEHLVTKLPDCFKSLLNDLFHTPFLASVKKRYTEPWHGIMLHEEELEIMEDENKYYLALDWQILNVRKYDKYSVDRDGIKKLIFRFGVIPSYQHDNLKALHIDIERREAHIVTGRAFGPWGSGLRQSSRPIQRYFKERVAQFWTEFYDWMEQKLGDEPDE